MPQKLTRFAHGFIAFVIVFSMLPFDKALAAGNTLYFNPNSQSVSLNGSFTISVKAYVETAAQTGRVSGTVQYPKSLLRVTATSTSGSSYGNPSVTQDVNSGTVGFSGSINPGPSGITQVFSITFQAIGAGTANLSFSGDSSINQSPTTRNGASYTIVNPNPTPVNPTPSKPTPAEPKPTIPSTPAPPPPSEPVTTPPDPNTVEDNTTVDESGVIVNVSSSPSYSEATIHWELSKEQESTELLYGTSKNTATTKTEVKKGEGNTYSVKLGNLKPGVKYYYTINSVGKDKKTSTYDSVVITKGYPVDIVVTQNSVPSANAQVRVGILNKTTNNEGVASFELAEGSYSATITAQDKTTQTVTFTIASKTVAEGKAPESQKYSFNLEAGEAPASDTSSVMLFIGALVGGGLLIAAGVFAFIVYRRRQFEGSYGADGSAVAGAPAVIVDDGYDWRQAAPQAPALPPTPMPIQPYADNVTIDPGYEEPKDMFELAKEQGGATSPAQTTPPPMPMPPQTPPQGPPPPPYSY